MHFTKFFSVVECDLQILNPTNHEKLMLLADYCSISDGNRVLDVGSGKGYMLREWAKRWRIEGTGLEINSSFIAQARSRASTEGVGDVLTFVEGDAKDFSPDPQRLRRGRVHRCAVRRRLLRGGGGVDARYAQTLGRPGDRRRVPPSPLPEEVAEREGVGPGDYRTLEEIAAVLEAHGLTLDGMIAGSTDDWDRYASRSWRAANAWAKANPDGPDRAEILSLTDKYRKECLRFTRRHLGWAIFVARRAVGECGE
jgi:SAM-dependent methyltransferase